MDGSDAASGPVLFLSHAGADTDAARRLKARLEAAPEAREAGMRVWFDKDDLRAGLPWQDQLAEALQRHATAFAVYVGSKGTVNWVEAEVRLALSRAMTSGGSFPFVPIIAATTDSAALPGFAQQFQAVRDVENSPGEFQKLLAAVLGRSDAAGRLKGEADPFFGLRAIDEEHSHLFFGRASETAELVQRLWKFGLVMVVGDSGSGKSSLVKAGLVPRWRGGVIAELEGNRPDEEIWQVVELRPGRDPRRAVGDAVFKAAGALGRSAEDQGTYLNWATGDDPELRRQGLRCGLPPDKTRTLVIVDQLEELVTLTPREYRRPFVELLLGLAEPGEQAFSVALTMRRDYYNLLAAPECRPLHQRLEAQDRAALYGLGRMTDDGLREIVTEPLRLAGIGQDERRELAESVLRDVGERPGDLALVQFALTRAWERRREFGNSVVRAYTGVGRVDGALAREAERVFANVLGGEANEPEVAATLIRLARLEGTAGPTRRVARRREFTDGRWTLLQTLADVKGNRLVLVQNLRSTDAVTPDAGKETAEIAHEALLTRWDRLHAWLSETPEDKRTLDRLADRTAEWADAATPKAKDRLLARTDAEREAFDALAHARPLWLSNGERDFVAASVGDQKARTRRAQWLRNFALAAAAILLVVAGLATWFWSEATQQAARVKTEAERAQKAETEATLQAELARAAAREALVERDKARTQLLAIQARRADATADGIERAGALALESIEIGRKKNRPTEVDAIEAARSALSRLPLQVLTHSPRLPVLSLAVLPDGQLASAGGDGIKLWPKDGSGEPVLLAHGSGVSALAVLPDGRLASAGDDGHIKLWPKDGSGEPVVLAHGSSVSAFVVLPDGRLASAGVEGHIKLWPKDGSGEPVVLARGSRVLSLAVLPNGWLASGLEDGIKLWSTDGTREPVVLAHGNDSRVISLTVLPDGRLASASFNGEIKLWPKDGRGEPVVLAHSSGVSALAVLPDGRLASADVNGQIKLWPKDGRGEPVVLAHGIWVFALAVLRDGRLASAGVEGQIKLWPKDGRGEPVVLAHERVVRALAGLPDGRLASAGGDGIKLWPTDDSGEPVVLARDPFVAVLAGLPDGRLASAGGDGQIKLWPEDGRGEPVVLAHGTWVSALAVLPDGRLASAGDDAQIKLWLIEEEKLIAALCLRAGRNLSKAEWARYIGSDNPWQPSCRDRPSNWRTPD